MKRKILGISLALALLAIVISGATLAYFTDTKAETNTFTVGSVKIELMESQLHRTNASGNPNLATLGMDNEMLVADDYSAAHGWNDKYFGDATIHSDASNYKAADGYFTVNSQNIVPGEYIRKNPYVKNTGNNDAFVRVRILLPKSIDPWYFIVETTTAINNGEITAGTPVEVARDGKTYVEYTYTYNKALKPNETTFWSCISAMKIGNNVTNETVTDISGFDILVEADAIQAETFLDTNHNGTAADEAFAAFDSAENP